jgi:hypothetical protein
MEQVRLRRAERELLDGTLKGSIEVLSEVLSLANSDAFGRASRVRGYVTQVVTLLNLPDAWQVESAALLSQIGCVALPSDIVQGVAAGRELTEQQAKAYEGHPQIGARLLERIPRLEEVAGIVARQRTPSRELAKEKGLAMSVNRGAQVLSACLELDELLTLGATVEKALSAMGSRAGAYSPELLRVMRDVKPIGAGTVAREVIVAELCDGMILAADVRSKNGTLIMSKGHRVSRSMIERLRNYHHLRGLQEPIRVLVEPPSAGSEAA